MRYSVWAYGCMIARFNDGADANEYAKAQSVKFPRGWKEVRFEGEIQTAYESGEIVLEAN